MIIVGAGMAGLIAGCVFPDASIYERENEPEQGAHRALLRFRSDAVSLITGIPFRKVRVHKGLWSGGAFQPPSISSANAYAFKVAARYHDRSIWDLEPVDRWVAPEDFHARLIRGLDRRISWATEITAENSGTSRRTPILSTIPLPVAARMWLSESGLPGVAFEYAPISVFRARLEGVDLHQTIYFPDESTSTYRASITGSLLIVESMNEAEATGAEEVLKVFGVRPSDIEPLGTARQTYGKIAPIEEHARREMIHRLTTDAGVYSVGRFAVWKNLLLDDLVQDLRIVKGLIEQNDIYAQRLHSIR